MSMDIKERSRDEARATWDARGMEFEIRTLISRARIYIHARTCIVTIYRVRSVLSVMRMNVSFYLSLILFRE